MVRCEWWVVRTCLAGLLCLPAGEGPLDDPERGAEVQFWDPNLGSQNQT